MMRMGGATTDPSTCRYCATHVSADFRRTLGDEHHIAHRCTGCDSRERLEQGSAAGKTVEYPPDPADQSWRNSGPRVRARADGGVGQ